MSKQFERVDTTTSSIVRKEDSTITWNLKKLIIRNIHFVLFQAFFGMMAGILICCFKGFSLIKLFSPLFMWMGVLYILCLLGNCLLTLMNFADKIDKDFN